MKKSSPTPCILSNSAGTKLNEVSSDIVWSLKAREITRIIITLLDIKLFLPRLVQREVNSVAEPHIFLVVSPTCSYQSRLFIRDLFTYIFNIATRAGTPQQHKQITLNRNTLAAPTTFGNASTYSFHVSTGSYSHCGLHYWELSLRPQTWKGSSLTTSPPKPSVLLEFVGFRGTNENAGLIMHRVWRNWWNLCKIFASIVKLSTKKSFNVTFGCSNI
jgi:hypothetical protein